ncbi:MAG: hypothetical protein ACP5T3_01155 [Candidatus Micrarchaeia archaeon]
MPENKTGYNRKRLVMIYAAAIIVVLVATAAIRLAVGSTSPLGRCSGIVVPQNKYACIQDLAQLDNNSSMCGMLPSAYAADCYYAIAKNETNASICKKISNATVMSECNAYVAAQSGNASICAGEGQPYNGECYFALAHKLLNASVCANIGNYTNRSICTSEILSYKAFSTKNIAYCYNISNSTNATIVNAVVANTSNPALENVTFALFGYSLNAGQQAAAPQTAYSAKDFCMIGTAYLSGNLTECQQIEPKLQNLCYSTVSLATRHAPSAFNFTQALQLCSNAGAYETLCKQSVTIAEAIRTLNGTLCNELQGNSANICYSTLAEHEKNASMCSKIANATIASACQTEITLNGTT